MPNGTPTVDFSSVTGGIFFAGDALPATINDDADPDVYYETLSWTIDGDGVGDPPYTPYSVHGGGFVLRWNYRYQTFDEFTEEWSEFTETYQDSGSFTILTLVALDGTLDATTAESGDLVGVAMPLDLDGVLDAHSGDDPAYLAFTKYVEGTLAATAGASGHLAFPIEIAGTIAATSGLVGGLGYTIPITGTIAAAASLSGAMVNTVYLAGTLPAASSLAASFPPVKQLYILEIGQVFRGRAVAAEIVRTR